MEYKFNTIEEYRSYMKENSRKWYANPENAEKKKAYQREYYKRKKIEAVKEDLNNIDNK